MKTRNRDLQLSRALTAAGIILLLLCSCCPAVSGAEDYIVHIWENKTFATFNFNKTEFKDDTTYPLPWPDTSNRLAQAFGNRAKTMMRTQPDQACTASAWSGVDYTIDIGNNDWNSIKDVPVILTFDYNYTIDTGTVTGHGSADAGVTHNLATSGWVDQVNGGEIDFAPTIGHKVQQYYRTVENAENHIEFVVYSHAHSDESATELHYSSANVTITNVTVAFPFRANFTAAPVLGAAPHTVQFTDRTYGSPAAWLWNFGDGSSVNATKKNPVHTYVKPGVYTVSLKASNARGSHNVTKSNYIIVVDLTPVANFTANRRSGTPPLTVQFRDLSSNFPSSWLWNFGDGSTVNATKRNPVHTYTKAGRYTVSLKATSVHGTNTTTKDQYITVSTVVFPKPNVTGIRPASGKQGELVRITNLAGTGFRAGANVFFNRTGRLSLVATNVTVVSATNITCTLKIPAGTLIGPWNVSVRNTDGKNGTRIGAFMVKTPVPPTVNNITPATGKAGTLVAITNLSGTVIKATNVTVVNARNITCTLKIPAGAETAPWTVRVINADLQAGAKTGAFAVTG